MADRGFFQQKSVGMGTSKNEKGLHMSIQAWVEVHACMKQACQIYHWREHSEGAWMGYNMSLVSHLLELTGFMRIPWKEVFTIQQMNDSHVEKRRLITTGERERPQLSDGF